ncbi:aldose epimerase family protein [uncultured Veillonella sp.]|uniref:aldose epimerase family protein n=1 Tax=uncultured Veillonella sp. TaxID=159268 RepID=UPI00260FB039|nr:aldose epimerase family protein [uncultured Veillonella sp.]
MTKAREFGRLPNGEIVYEYELSNEYATVHILSYGAIIKDFIVKSLNRNIVLGCDTLEDYLQGHAYLGATVGRVANRISKARTIIEDTEYTWTPNNGPNLLHSGDVSLSFANWQVLSQVFTNDDAKDSQTLALQTKIKGADDGFPGDLDVILYANLVGPELRLCYAYTTTTSSVVNITNHSYFNLNGVLSVGNHRVRLNAPYIAPFGGHSIPTGDVESVQNTLYDLTKWTCIGTQLAKYATDLAEWRGYDHYYMQKEAGYNHAYVTNLRRKYTAEEELLVDTCHTYEEVDLADGRKAIDTGNFELCGEFRVPDLTLRIYSNAPGYQFYTGNWLQEKGRNGVTYGPHAGMCIEPQFIPDDCNLPYFGESFTRPNVIYVRNIVYEIDTRRYE